MELIEYEFFGWHLEISAFFKPYFDRNGKKIALLTKEDDEIFATLRIDENGDLVLQPNWNHFIIYKGKKHLAIYPNWTGEEEC